MIIARRGAGLITALLTLVAAAALCASTPAAAAAPTRAKTTHVAIVVAGAGHACVPWHSGMTGADVLAAAYTVRWGQQAPYIGFVLRIDGQGTLRPDDEHYWSYWRNTGGGWAYSGRGATNAAVAPGSVEGWSYVNGQSSAPAPPTSSYADVCAGQDPQDPSTSPTRHPSTHPHRPGTSVAHAPPRTRTPPRDPATTRHHRSTRTSTVPPAPGPTTTRTTTAPTSRAPTTRSATRSAAPTTAAPGGAAAPRTSASTALAAATAVHTEPRAASEDTAALPSWSTALALLVVAAIGAAALVRIRGSRP